MSNSELMLDVGQANDLKLAMRKGGWANDDLKQLENQSVLTNVLKLVRGEADLQLKKGRHTSVTIDLGGDPYVPRGWRAGEHQKGGLWRFNAENVDLYLADGQKDGKILHPSLLRRELEGQQVLNANVLDWLLVHRGRIPEAWKDKQVFFWGTIYYGDNHSSSVRYLHHVHGGWQWEWCSLINGACAGACFAALLKNPQG